MPVRRALRSVVEDDAPRPTKARKSVAQAASNGTTRELLVAMRDRTASSVDDPNTAARDLAALTKRLLELVREIEAIDARAGEEASESAGQVQDGAFDSAAV